MPGAAARWRLASLSRRRPFGKFAPPCPLLSVASAVIVRLHFEGWEHFSESREDIAAAFARAGLADRLRWPVPGRTIAVA